MAFNSFLLPTAKLRGADRLSKELKYINGMIIELLNEFFLKFVHPFILSKVNWRTDIAKKTPRIGLEFYCVVQSNVYNKYLKPRGMKHANDIDILFRLGRMAAGSRYYYNV